MPRGRRTFIVAVDVTMRQLYKIHVPRRTTIEPDHWEKLIDDAEIFDSEGRGAVVAFVEEVQKDGSRKAISTRDPVRPPPPKPRRKRPP